MLGADILMIEGLSLFGCQREDFFNARRVRNIADDLLIRARAHELFDILSDSLQVNPVFLKHVDRYALAQFDKAEQKVFSAYEVVVETVSFLSGQSYDLHCAWREIVQKPFGFRQRRPGN